MPQVNPGETIPISYHSEVGTTGLYPQGKIYNGATLVTTVNFTEVGNGYYYYDYTPDGSYKYLMVKIVPYKTAAYVVKDEENLETSVDLVVEYFYRPSMGGGSVSAEIDYKKLVQEVWNYQINNKKAQQVLLDKSEFNPKSDIVKTDLKIEKPVFNTRILQDLITDKMVKLEEVVRTTKTAIIKQSVDLKPIIAEIKKIDNKNDLNNLLLVIDKINNKIEKLPQEKVSLNEINIELKNIKEQISQGDSLTMIDSLEERIKELTKEIKIDRKENKDEKIVKELETLKTIKNTIQENQEMIEMLNKVDDKRIEKVLKVLEKLYHLISLKKELVYVEKED